MIMSLKRRDAAHLSGHALCARYAVLSGNRGTPRVFVPTNALEGSVHVRLVETLLTTHRADWEFQDACATRDFVGASPREAREMLEEADDEARTRWGDGEWHFETSIISPIADGTCNRCTLLRRAMGASGISRTQVEKRDAEALVAGVSMHAVLASGRTCDPVFKSMTATINRHWQARWFRPHAYLRDGDPSLAVSGILTGGVEL